MQNNINKTSNWETALNEEWMITWEVGIDVSRQSTPGKSERMRPMNHSRYDLVDNRAPEATETGGNGRYKSPRWAPNALPIDISRFRPIWIQNELATAIGASSPFGHGLYCHRIAALWILILLLFLRMLWSRLAV